MLRVFFPRQRDFKVEDLMFEEGLGAPILQLAIGRFLPYGSRCGVVSRVLRVLGGGEGARVAVAWDERWHRPFGDGGPRVPVSMGTRAPCACTRVVRGDAAGPCLVTREFVCDCICVCVCVCACAVGSLPWAWQCCTPGS